MDCRIGSICVVGKHRDIGSPQPRRIGDLETDRVRGVAISVEVIEAEVEMSKAVNLAGGVTDIRRREPGETGLRG
jgi:hypothetical protein